MRKFYRGKECGGGGGLKRVYVYCKYALNPAYHTNLWSRSVEFRKNTTATGTQITVTVLHKLGNGLSGEIPR
jgi:hypothetical protein